MAGKGENDGYQAQIQSFEQNDINQNLHHFVKLKGFAGDNFKFDKKNGIKFSKRFENTVGKGEFARHEQFLLFPQCFQKSCSADT